MSENQIWNPMITELMTLFRESLTGLLPVMEKAHLSWQEGEAYDEWDQIAASLFKGIVVSSLQWGLAGGVFTELSIPAYDVVYPDYSKFSFIECLGDAPRSDERLLFHKFVTDELPFDTMRCYRINNRGQKLAADPQMRPVADARFALCLRRSPDELTRYESLTVRIARAQRDRE